ncbi:MAG: hypothetical protein P8X95_02960 [Anaerolineales bacterium]|jgi:hypothetical protein
MTSKSENITIRELAINFGIEILIYGVLVVGYFYLVLRLLGPWLSHLFQNDLVTYAVIGLSLIVAQGIVLEQVTSLILNWLNLNRLE